ncbi:hypothetical protein [Bradyrhizobium sp. JR3.5]
MTKMTDAEMRKITKLVVADLERRVKDDAARHKARPENRSARLREAEAEVRATEPRDSRAVYLEMSVDKRPAKRKPVAKKQRTPNPTMNRAALLAK